MENIGATAIYPVSEIIQKSILLEGCVQMFSHLALLRTAVLVPVVFLGNIPRDSAAFDEWVIGSW